MKTAAWLLCAWVLWSYTVDRPLAVYSVESGYESRSGCDSSVADYAAVMKQMGYEVKSVKGEAVGRKGTERTRYFCLPDTVDPRARN